VKKPEPTLEFTFNGKSLRAIPGQSIAAAIFSDNGKVLRSTRIKGDERSIFCGIGICWDCVVTVNGIANQRACLVEVSPGMVVTS
jgi:aerobic-type carbon monoxide dehydrogenase small subunit (CoxS/CutS family)